MSRHLTYLLPFDFFTSYFGRVVIILVVYTYCPVRPYSNRRMVSSANEKSRVLEKGLPLHCLGIITYTVPRKTTMQTIYKARSERSEH